MLHVQNVCLLHIVCTSGFISNSPGSSAVLYCLPIMTTSCSSVDRVSDM